MLKIRKLYEQFVVDRNAKKRAAKHAKERARLIAKFQLSHEAKVLIAALTATNFVPSGEHLLANTKIITLANQDQMIMIQAHLSDGRLVKVFKEINENNLNVLAEKLTTKKETIVDILDDINLALTELTSEWPPEREAVEAMPMKLKLVREFLSDAGTKLLKIENI